MPGVRTNPFSIRYQRPGAIPFLFPAGQELSVEALYRRLADHDWFGEVVGAEGTGKSTLLCGLEAEAAARGHAVTRLRLREGERFVSPELAAAASRTGPPPLLLLDGAEQFGRWRVWRLRARCRRAGWGLLVTSHRPLGLPLLHRTHVDGALAEAIAARVLAQTSVPEWVRASEAPELLAAAGGNMRAVLLRMYDFYEARAAPPARP